MASATVVSDSWSSGSETEIGAPRSVCGSISRNRSRPSTRPSASASSPFSQTLFYFCVITTFLIVLTSAQRRNESGGTGRSRNNATATGVLLGNSDRVRNRSGSGGFSVGGRNKTGGLATLRNRTRGEGFGVGKSGKVGGAGAGGGIGGMLVTTTTTNVPPSVPSLPYIPVPGGIGVIGAPEVVVGGGSGSKSVKVGLVLSYSMFMYRDYQRAVLNVLLQLQKYKSRYKFLQEYNFTSTEVTMIMITVSPSPKDILDALCEKFLSTNVSAILYLTNVEQYGRSTAASQYFLKLVSYLGIPVIAWNADNSGLTRRASQSEMILQLAPSVEHQAEAMLSILVRYNWGQFAIVTSQIAGHEDFVQAVRDKIQVSDFKFNILTTVMVIGEDDLVPLVGSDVRIFLLYCTRDEASLILKNATKLGLTGTNFVWIVTQSVIGNTHDALPDLPVGMLGVHFNTSYEALKSEISNVFRVFANGVEAFLGDPENIHLNLSTALSCDGFGDVAKWSVGEKFFRYLQNVSIDVDAGPSKPNMEFNPEGTLKAVELQIMNLRPGATDRQLVWEQIGVWQSWKDFNAQLDIKDIIWPGYSHKYPDGVPDKFNLKIGFLEEHPFIKMADPDPVTGKCSPERGVQCRIASEHELVGLNHSEVIRNSSYYQCCSGFCIDLLMLLAEQIGFTYDLSRVSDGRWGTLHNGKWNGLIAELNNRKVDLALSSLMINAEREEIVDFSVPFMDAGVAVLTAKRTGIISATAYLEPFQLALWLLVCLVGMQVYSVAIFLFEWLSPIGFDMKREARPGAPFSFFRSCWLVWARLFQASVHVDPPRGFTAKFVVHVWSMFAVVFLATYTANLAVFMITREDSHKFKGIHDPRLTNPYSTKPPMKFGTVPFTHADSLLSKHFREMHSYMNFYSSRNVSEGVAAVRDGALDGFIYDGPVLQYNALQDSIGNCSLIIEGPWYAHTGYGFAFPRHSKHLQIFNKYLMDFKETGELERLRRFYFTGPCSQAQRDSYSIGSRSDPLSLKQFYSAFFLLFCGVLFASFLLILEHAYSRYARNNWVEKPPGCFTLISQNMGRAFYHYPYMGRPTLTGSNEPKFSTRRSGIELYPTKCTDPICTTNLLRTKHHLNIALARSEQLENRLRLLSDPKFRKKRSSCFPGGAKAPMTFSELSVSAIISPHEFSKNHHAHSHHHAAPEAFDRPRTGSRIREYLYRAPHLTEIAEIETVL